MELFERIRKLAVTHFGSVAKLAALIGFAQTTFNAYLKPERQDNLWPLLPQILKVVPNLSRDWLYFGEGEMFGGRDVEKTLGSDATELVALKKELAKVKDKYIALLEEMKETYKQIALAETGSWKYPAGADEVRAGSNVHKEDHLYPKIQELPAVCGKKHEGMD